MNLYSRESLVDDCRRRMTELIHDEFSTRARLIPDADTLADLLDVSRSVARQATRDLVDSGFIARRGNGFITQHVAASTTDEPAGAESTTAEPSETPQPDSPPTDDHSHAIAASERLLARWSRESLRGVS